jgi:hypothetical protein
MSEVSQSIRDLSPRLETTDLDTWGAVSMELAALGAPAVDDLVSELLKLLSGDEYPRAQSIVVQRQPSFALADAREIAATLYSRPPGHAQIEAGAMAMSVHASKMHVGRNALVQSVNCSVLYAGERASINGALATEIWVAPGRTLNAVYAEHIFAGFPAPASFTPERLYEVDDPTEAVIVSGWNRVWGIMEALTRIGDSRALSTLQLVADNERDNLLGRVATDYVRRLGRQ